MHDKFINIKEGITLENRSRIKSTEEKIRKIYRDIFSRKFIELIGISKDKETLGNKVVTLFTAVLKQGDILVPITIKENTSDKEIEDIFIQKLNEYQIEM